MRRRGFFLALEGIDGSGTTTIGRMLEQELKSKGIMSYYTFEPTSGPIGSLIKNILARRIVMNRDGEKEDFDQISVALLFAADRIDHLKNEVEPLLKKGYVVISDRYKYSSYAYQSLFAEDRWVKEINRYSIDPDMLIFLDVDVKTGISRVGMRGNKREIYEREDLLRRIRSNYLREIKDCKFAKVVDANRTLDEVYLDTRELLYRGLERYGYKIQVD